MNHIIQFYYVFLLLTCSLLACNTGPTVVEASEHAEFTSQSSGIFSEEGPKQASPDASSVFSEKVHKVVVHEVLPASRYVYLKVTEGVQEYWVATRKQEITVGNVYYYTGGLLKTQFESKEYNRVFDRIFLVSKLVPQNHGKPGIGTDIVKIPTHAWPEESAKQKTAPTLTQSASSTEGFLSIAQLTQSPETYAGKTVKISGICVKVNPNIMNRNWVHVQDGTADDYDLVITTSAKIPEGAKIQMEATVALNRDFGAGYSYQLILENGKLLSP